MLLHRDHPRVCGKNMLIRWGHRWRAGSPPRVREKPIYLVKVGVRLRITPACAGKTYTLILEKYHHQDHPRVCGKNTILCSSLSWITGSPPRVREKLDRKTSLAKAIGITPACAGKTKSSGRESRMDWDHPRVCGKNVGLMPHQHDF